MCIILKIIITARENEAVDSRETTQSPSRHETSTKGRLLLEDNFNSFNASLWKREIKMPLEPVSILSLLFTTVLLKYSVIKFIYSYKYMEFV